MINAVPFMGCVDHGFFSYHPNLFESLARYNSYETLGLWVAPCSDGRGMSFVPWQPELLEVLPLKSNTMHVLVAAQRKIYDREFCVPFQEMWEPHVSDETIKRYAMVVDGEVMDGKRARYLTKNGVIARNDLPKPDAYLSETASLSGPLLKDIPGRTLLVELQLRIRRRISSWFS